MAQDLILQKILSTYASHIPAGGIEEKSITTAMSMISSGNSVVGEQIIGNLVLPADVKKDIFEMIKNPVSEKVVEPKAAAVPPVEPLAPVVKPVKTPRVEEKPKPKPKPAPVVQKQESKPNPPAQRKPLVKVPENIPVATKQPKQPKQPEKIILKKSLPVINLKSKLEKPIPVAAVPEKKIFEIPDAPAPSAGQMPSAVSSKPVSRVELPTVEPTGHLRQLMENKARLNDLLEQGDSEDATAAYEKVFENPVTEKKTYEVPSILHTAPTPPGSDIPAPPSSTDSYVQQKEREHEMVKAKKMFDAAEAYMKKAYAGGHQPVIISAGRQVDHLLEEYPDYVAEQAEHVERIAQFRARHDAARAATASTNPEVKSTPPQRVPSLMLGDIRVMPSMTISGKESKYTIDTIIENTDPVADDTHRIRFIDPNGSIYMVPSQRLHHALTHL